MPLLSIIQSKIHSSCSQRVQEHWTQSTPVSCQTSSLNAQKHTQHLSLELVSSRHCLFDAVCNKLDALCFFDIEVDEEGPAPPPLSTHPPELLDSFSSCLTLVFGPAFLLTCFLAFCALSSAFLAFSSSFCLAFWAFSAAFLQLSSASLLTAFSSLLFPFFRFSFSSCSMFFLHLFLLNDG